MYKFYKEIPCGRCKYVGTFKSTLDPNYHSLISELDRDGLKWYVTKNLSNGSPFVVARSKYFKDVPMNWNERKF